MEENYVSYQHVEKFGTQHTAGIEKGMCYVFPKLDGANGKVWCFNDEIMAGSRNRQLSLDANGDNQGFYHWILTQERYKEFFIDFPDMILFGEWLVPHTLRTYSDDAWRKFYVFDVIHNDGKYARYEEYSPILDMYGIEYISPICKIENPSMEKIIEIASTQNTYLIKTGAGVGEGVVVKNYDYRNKWGRVIWAKVVLNEFKDKFRKATVQKVNDTSSVEEKIVGKYVTKSLVDKEFAKIYGDGGWDKSYIPRLITTVFYCLVTEETWNFIKHFKNPTVDFNKLARLTTLKIREVKPEVFQ